MMAWSDPAAPGNGSRRQPSPKVPTYRISSVDEFNDLIGTGTKSFESDAARDRRTR